ncbi:MAG: DUF3592 domain-containing protein [Rhodothermales bacterium]
MATQDMDPQESAKVLRITGHALVLLGAALLLFGVYFVRTANESASWPRAEGRVDNLLVRWSISQSERGRVNPHKDYYYVVKYSYEVEGTSYTGTRYSLGNGDHAEGKDFDTEEEARAAGQQRFPVRSAVPVAYDPEDPTMAVLRAGASGATYVPLILGVLFLAVGLALRRASGSLRQRQPAS